MSLDRSLITSYVKNKFMTSDYIKNRIKPTGTQKYYDEEIQFWVEQIYNSGWEETLFNTEFNTVYETNHDKSLSSISPNDYIGQTFYIDNKSYPKGMFIHDICIFTALEDTSIPLTLDLRKLVNGIPEVDTLPLSSVTIRPADDRTQAQIIPWEPDAIEKNSLRQFKFDHPVFVEPGWYCFTLKTSSSKYSVYIAENGKGTLNTGKTVVNPYLGDFIYSSQGESWVIDPTKDLCFELSKSEFLVGERNLYLNIQPEQYSDEFAYDLLHFKTSITEVPGHSYLEEAKATVTEFGTNNSNDVIVFKNSNAVPPSHSTINNNDGSLMLTLKLINKDPNLTPIVDLHDTGVVLVRNIVDSYSEYISDSELGPNGSAFAKYVTKPIILNEGFDADGITVYLDVNRPTGSDIELFYKVLNKYDTSVAFENARWRRLPKKSTETASQLSVDFSEEEYQQLNMFYLGENGETYTTFNQLAIKVVFYTDDPTKVPSIKNFRAIASV